MKRKIAMAMGVVLMLGSLAACGGNDAGMADNKSNQTTGTESEGAANNGEVEKVVFSFLAFNKPSEEREQAVEEAINNITRDSIGVEVDLLIMDGASYIQQIPLMLAGGEEVDAYSTLGMSYTSHVNSGYCLDLEENDLIQTYGQGIIDTLGEEYLNGCRIDGTLYGIHGMTDMASPNGYVIGTEYLEGIGYDGNLNEINEISEEELEDIFAKLHEKYPDKTVLVEQPLARTSVYNDYPGGDWFGVLMDPENSLELSDLYETDEYMDYCKTHYKWNQLGYISSDALTNQDSATALVGAGSAMAYACGMKAGILSQEGQSTGRQLTGFITDDRYIIPSGGLATMTWVINSNTEHPEATMKLMNAFYTNPELTDLLTYGIEGEDYVVGDDGLYTYPDGTDASTVYHPNVAVFMFNEFIAGVWEGNDPDVWEQTKEMNSKAAVSKAMGFTFDNTPVMTEYTALTNVYEEYRNQIEYGFLDPEVGIPEMVEKMKASGLEKYIAEKQSQLDAWEAETGK